MYVKAKKIAVSGILAAFSAVLMLLGTLIETNSLFLIAAASFCVGITIREWGVRYGFAFWAASILVNVIVTPNRTYCITYAAMGFYLLLSEFLWEKIARSKTMRGRTWKLWIGKYVIFNVTYVPALVIFQDLFFVKRVTGLKVLAVWFAGQLLMLIYDKAYRYFQGVIWEKLRIKLLRE